MKALLWKELRQQGIWSALLLLLVSSAVGFLLSEFDHRPYTLPTEDLPVAMIFCAGSVAILLGLLQTVLEQRRDQWAFLMHRGRSSSDIFRAKTLAAAIMYSVIVFLPLIGAVLWIRSGGVQQYPFSWYQLLPTLAVIVACFALYFGAVASVIWKGPWYISRAFPLAAACLPVLIVAFVFLGFTEFVPLSVFLTVALLAAGLAMAAWGVFIRSGESAGRPRIGTLCLGFATFIGVQAALIGILFAVGGTLDFLMNRPGEWPAQNFEYHFVNRAGHLCRLEGTPGYAPSITKITDLDDPPASRKYDRLLNKGFQEVTSQSPKYPEWDPISLSSRTSGSGFQGRRRVLDFLTMSTSQKGTSPKMPSGIHYSSLGSPQGRVDWIYSRADRLIYGYAEDYELRDSLPPRLLPPRLVAIVGPEEVTDGSRIPEKRFSQVRWLSLLRDSFYPRGHSVGSRSSKNMSILFDDGLYELDLQARTIHRTIPKPPDQEVLDLVLGPQMFGIIYSESVAVYSQKGESEVAFPYPEMSRARLEYTVPLPKELREAEYYNLGRVPNQDLVVFAFSGKFLFTRLDGTVVKEYVVPEKPIHRPPAFMPILATCAALLPAGPVLLFVAGDALSLTTYYRGPRFLEVMWSQSQTGTVVAFVVFFLVSFVCWMSARRTAWTYGFDQRTSRWWQGLALFLGPAGLLTLWFLRNWSVRVACRGCQQLRPVDRDTCPQCGEQFTPPETNGTEIFTRAPQPVAQPA